MDRGIRHLNDPDGFQIPITPMERARLMARKPIDDEEITLSGVDALDDRRRERASTLLDLDIRNLDQKSDPSVEAPREPQVNQTRIVFQRTLTLVGPHYISPPPHSDTSVYSEPPIMRAGAQLLLGDSDFSTLATLEKDGLPIDLDGIEEEDDDLIIDFDEIDAQPKKPIKPDLETGGTTHIDIIASSEITVEMVREASDYYRELFGNTMHFIACKSCDFRQTAREAFKTGEEFVALEQMDNPKKQFFCPCCSDKTNKMEMERVYDATTIFNNFREKLMGSEDSFLSILRREDNSIAGLAFAYITTAGRERELEWGDYGCPYMRGEAHIEQKPEFTEERFLECLNTEIFSYRDQPIDRNTKFLAWNCISVSPDMKGKMLDLTVSLFHQIPNDRTDLLVLGDVKVATANDIRESKNVRNIEIPYRFFLALGGKPGKKFFGPNADTVLIGGKVSDALEYFHTYIES